ncbi:vWA domain-containing protein [Sphingopyxis sp.]|uniref:vWA domain-containing protein n=1 Tax=Sphingopyxis sp. TaxID=1908224 RepID=UPI002B478537|nr:VWA domain-containing protein [Sphingopyxis sp.]HJS12930.1 VWA domain-containing protein [Sphingopyxis sp.]
MRSRFLTGTTMIAVLATGLAPTPLTIAAARTPAQGFCRNADPLPRLDAEQQVRQQQNGGYAKPATKRERDERRADMAVEAIPAPMAPPPPAPLPPPPPPAPVYESESGSDAVVVTGSRVEGGLAASKSADYAPAAASPPVPGSSSDYVASRMPPPRPYPQPQPQSGILTAGEHDDLLNPELYAAYVNRSSLGQDVGALPRVDTTRVVTVKVSDRNGQPVPFADVKVACSDGNSITMATQADGSAVFFPGLDRLSERVTVSAAKAGRPIAAARPLFVVNAPGGQTVGLTANQLAAKATKLDLMLVVDTTGSMGDEIRFLQAEMRAIISSITAKHRDLDIRVGFVFYRDLGDEYVTRTVTFDRDIARAQGALAAQYATGGGDYPEAMDQALIRAVAQEWRPDAVKSMLLVADAPPHGELFGRTWAAAEAARAKRIHITPVAASGVADKAEYAMRAMAAATQSRYLFLTDDSGVGNPHAPPAIDCYLVTRLDALVRRVIDTQISGRRIEPDDNEIIRSVGKYDAGKCILPADFKWQNG